MRKKLRIILVIVITIACIFLGIQTRKVNAILVTQISTKSDETLSYMIETKKNNIIMIDGGSDEDSEHLEQLLLGKGGVVKAWFVTIAHSQNFGALQKIMENDKIQIENIYISFNPMEWYETYEPDRYQETKTFLQFITAKQPITQISEPRFEILVDNLYFTVLNVANPELNGEFAGLNQSMVIKVNNTYKSMIFMGNIANEAAQKFKDNNLDEIQCDAVQISNNHQQNVDYEIYQKMEPQYVFMPTPQNSDKTADNQYRKNLKNTLNPKEIYASEDTDITTKIW